MTKKSSKEIRAQMAEINPEAITPDGFDGNKFGYDEAIIGYVEQCGHAAVFCSAVFCYDAEKMVDILVRDHKMTTEQAHEWLEFNTFGSYNGENSPLYLYRFQL